MGGLLNRVGRPFMGRNGQANSKGPFKGPPHDDKT